MNEPIEFPFSFELEMKIERYAKDHNLTRDEAIAKALSDFLSTQGL